ncbi:MAG: hypothetical protein RIG63_29255 [Coleofasciculus chthonoplastes F3-SA18-01]|uniref:cyclic GMP-AMP synthase DncV-like nucleotidyltransferase n=1 Tax=Coleofasciculus chthonoplastes TaxID=64178 RepID=UPI0032FFDE25
MADCHKLFLKFNSIIELNAKRKESLRISREAVRNKIRNFFKEKQNGLYPRFHGQGSFMMNTIIKPLDGEFDIDDGIYFLVKHQPLQSIDTFHRWICEAVDSHTKEKPIDKMTCARVVYKGHYHIDLPIYYIVEGSCPKLAHKRDGWISSDPKTFIKWFQSQTDDKGQLRRIVRYFKAWIDCKSGTLPSGLIFSILATENIRFNARDDIALYETLKNIKNKLDSNFTCYRPTTPTYEDLLKEYSQTNKEYFKNQIDRMISSAKKALDDNTSQKDACKEWQKHFGDRFPCHLIEDKTDELLSAAFTTPSLTFPNRPIIPKKPGGFA